MSKKLPQALSIEELVSQVTNSTVEQGEASSVFTTENNILEFLSFYKIQTGEYKTKVSILKKLYRNWSNHRSYPDKYITMEISKYVKYNKGYFYINYNIIDLSAKAKELFFTNNVTKKLTIKNTNKFLDKFFELHGVKAGKYAVENMVLYYIYEYWAYNNKHRNILTPTEFTSKLKHYFEYYKDNGRGNSIFYYIDKDSLTIDGATLEKAKAWAKTYKEKSYNRKTKAQKWKEEA